MNKQQFKSFFENYAKNVDNAGSLGFWALSDTLVEEIIKKSIPLDLDETKTILDAGGGTARWAIKLSKTFKSKFIVYDLSEDMLAQAEKNISDAKLVNRIKTVHGDLCNMDKIQDESIDYITSIYSPISFVYTPEKAAKELYRILKPGGKIIIMGHSYYNAIDSKINNYIAPKEELNYLNLEHRVKWAPHVPELVTYSKETMEALLSEAGFTPDKTYGVPVFIRPGAEDWDPENKKRSLVSKELENKEFFRAVVDLEMEHNSKSEVANRGMNIFAVAKK